MDAESTDYCIAEKELPFADGVGEIPWWIGSMIFTIPLKACLPI